MASLIAGFVIAFLLAALPGKAAIAWLQKLNAKQNVSEDAPTSHAAKQGTPTMGGLLILFSLTVTVLGYSLVQRGSHRHPAEDYNLLPLLLMTLGFGAIGFSDDYLSVKRGKNLGLKARQKLIAQCIIAIGFVIWMAKNAQPGLTTYVDLAPQTIVAPFVFDLSWWYYPVAVLFLVGFSNATNITDGLDGLSSGLTIMICLALTVLVSVLLPDRRLLHPDLGFMTVALAGALAGFLWWNAHPAKMFMGDTSSLALGACLAGIALIGKAEIGLIIASLVCWAELISVMIQVSVFKWRRRKYGIEYARSHRIFRRTPLHHHFEEIGWPETMVVMRFWIAGALCASLALLWGRG